MADVFGPVDEQIQEVPVAPVAAPGVTFSSVAFAADGASITVGCVADSPLDPSLVFKELIFVAAPTADKKAIFSGVAASALKTTAANTPSGVDLSQSTLADGTTPLDPTKVILVTVPTTPGEEIDFAAAFRCDDGK
jgi:hypothetical protein